MTQSVKSIPQALVEALSYNAETGIFHWVRRLAQRAPIGSIAGSLNSHRHIKISYQHKLYEASRIAWRKFYGYDPPEEIDHINRNPADNRICNLRLATRVQNAQNCSIRDRNTSGFSGVHYVRHTGKWQARITIEGRRHNLGCYMTREAAFEIYKEASLKLHKEFSPFYNSTRDQND